MLNELAAKDKKIEVVEINENNGYGAGMKAGIKKSNARFIITNHADGQFDAYTFFITHLKEISEKKPSIIPKRLNRSFLDSINSAVLRFIIRLIKWEKIHDFNGQPKVIDSNLIGDIESYPNDFTFEHFIDLLSFKNHSLVQFYHRNIAYLITFSILILGYFILRNKIDNLL